MSMKGWAANLVPWGVPLLDRMRKLCSLVEKCWKGYTIHIVPQYLRHYIKQVVYHLYKTLRRFLILCAVPSLLTPHSTLDSEVDFNASYLENAIFVPPVTQDLCIQTCIIIQESVY